MRAVNQRKIGLSFDVDSVDSHLLAFGIRPRGPDVVTWQRAVPRIVESLARRGAYATFFVVAADAQRNASLLRELSVRGHEIASHSVTHPVPFGGLDTRSLIAEVRDSKAILEDIVGKQVLGFRAPGWDNSRRTARAVAMAGYMYDASFFPSFVWPALRWCVDRNSRRCRRTYKLDSGRGRRTVWTDEYEGNPLVRIPVCTCPLVHFPVYHTMRWLLPRLLFATACHVAIRYRRQPTYQFHTVDFLSIPADDLDGAIRRHPGMRHPLVVKLRAAEEILELLDSQGTLCRMRTLAEEMLATRALTEKLASHHL